MGLNFYKMTLLLEEQVEQDYSALISNVENIPLTIGYHVSKAVFSGNAFDDSRLGSNTQESAIGTKIYSIDSVLGHQFVEDPNILTDYDRLNLLGDKMYKANLRPGKVAVIEFKKLENFFPRIDPTSVKRAKQFRTWLLNQGYGGVRIIGSGVGNLTNNALCILSSSFIKIRSIKNLKSGTELKSKDGDFDQQIQQIIARNKEKKPGLLSKVLSSIGLIGGQK
jgi:hypothetical protein